jgi:hypothetical protein
LREVEHEPEGVGSSAPTHAATPRYSMLNPPTLERATALGGELMAGPTPSGWRVSCQLPLSEGSGR